MWVKKRAGFATLVVVVVVECIEQRLKADLVLYSPIDCGSENSKGNTKFSRHGIRTN